MEEGIRDAALLNILLMMYTTHSCLASLALCINLSGDVLALSGINKWEIW